MGNNLIKSKSKSDFCASEGVSQLLNIMLQPPCIHCPVWAAAQIPGRNHDWPTDPTEILLN